ncbi:MAG: LacI family DNA-binding transcriptional regulator [Victivallales bacterium]|nr:LacI family DNA-binding transcriptional regulator [Victivallales bacterium]
MVTIKDIAAAAGVSHTTVSIVLNGRSRECKISDARAAKILELASRMGYLRNEIAHSFSQGVSKIIGVIIPDTASEYSGRLLYGISQCANMHGYMIKLFYMPQDPALLVKQLVGQRVAGVVTYDLSSPVLHRQLHEGLARFGIPLCVAAGNSPVESGLRVFSDLVDGCTQALRHFMEQGHCQVSLLSQQGGFAHWSTYILEHYNAVAKKMSFKTIRTCRGIDEFLRKPTSALFCVSDFVALNAIMTLRKAGLHVPADVSVIGLGNLSFGVFSNPTLTTIDEQQDSMGKFALELLLRQIEQKNLSDFSVGFPMRLLIRESTAPPNSK